MAVLFANNATATLASGINGSTTTITVAAGKGALYPSPTGGNYFMATLQEGTVIEIVRVTARSGDIFTVVRGQEGTSGSSFTSAATLEVRLTAGGLNVFPQVVGAFSGGSILNGGSISGTTLTFGAADETNPGMVSTTAQTWAGVKSFTSSPQVFGTGADTRDAPSSFITFTNTSLPNNPTFGIGNPYVAGVGLEAWGVWYRDDTFASGEWKICLSGERSGTFASVLDSIRRSVHESFINNGDQKPFHRIEASRQALQLGAGGFYVAPGGAVRTGGTLTLTTATVINPETGLPVQQVHKMGVGQKVWKQNRPGSTPEAAEFGNNGENWGPGASVMTVSAVPDQYTIQFVDGRPDATNTQWFTFSAEPLGDVEYARDSYGVASIITKSGVRMYVTEAGIVMPDTLSVLGSGTPLTLGAGGVASLSVSDDTVHVLNGKTFFNEGTYKSTGWFNGGGQTQTTQEVFLVGTGAGPQTTYLRPIGGENWMVLRIKNVAQGVNNSLTIVPDGSDTISGQASLVIPAGAAVTLVSEGTDWHVWFSTGDAWLGNFIPVADGTQTLGTAARRWLSVYTSTLRDANSVNRMLLVGGQGNVYVSGVADGAGSVAHLFNTNVAFSTTGSKLAQWMNNSVEKAYLDKDGGFTGAFLDILNGPSVGVSGALRVRFRSNNGRAEVSENGGIWRHFTPEEGYFDIRDYGAVPGPSGKAATTAAFDAIFAEATYSYFPTVDGLRNAIIFVPMTLNTAWYVDELAGYIGSPGASLNIIGEVTSGRAGTEGSVLFYDGPTGGTLLDLQALNNSVIENITFHGNRKAKILLHVRQYWNVPNSSQVGSSGTNVYNCMFLEPENEYDSILFAVGEDDDPPNTLQTSEVRCFRTFFQGIDLGPGLTKQGWGFKALVPGNTKNFIFENCTFGQLHRGIDVGSGYLYVKDCNGGNIGYDRGDSAMIYGSGNTWTIEGGGMENGTTGYYARFLSAGQGTNVTLNGVYLAGNCPADDGMISLGGSANILGLDLVNSRTTTSAIAWTGSTAVLVGQERTNDGGKFYRCITAGTTAGAGGPTGTGSSIMDGTAEWRYVTTGNSNEARIYAGNQEVSGWGGVSVKGCAFPANTTALKFVPIYDGSGNILAASTGKANTDYAKSVSHKVQASGCSTGIYGGNINVQLPDFNGSDLIITRDQIWNNGIPDSLTVIRNANGVYIVTVPYTAVQGAGGGIVTVGHFPLKYKLTDCIIDVTAGFAGTGGLTGIEAEVGIGAGDTDAFLTAQNVETPAQFGIDPAEHGIELANGRWISSWAGPQQDLIVKFTCSAGLLANLNAGSLNIYIEGHRLGN